MGDDLPLARPFSRGQQGLTQNSPDPIPESVNTGSQLVREDDNEDDVDYDIDLAPGWELRLQKSAESRPKA